MSQKLYVVIILTNIFFTNYLIALLNIEQSAQKLRLKNQVIEAINKNDIDSVNSLLNEMSELKNLQETPVHVAAENNISQAINLLIKHKADINAVSLGGLTPLHYATGERAYEAIELLIDNGADVNFLNDALVSPLCEAALLGDTKSIRLLILGGASTDISYFYTLRFKESVAPFFTGPFDVQEALIKQVAFEVQLEIDNLFKANNIIKDYLQELHDIPVVILDIIAEYNSIKAKNSIC